MSGPGPSTTLKDEKLENIAQAASRILLVDGKAMASQYILSALNDHGFISIPQKKTDKLPHWGILAVADRSLWLSTNNNPPKDGK